MAELTFLGTGNYLAQGRYWNSFVVDGSVLVEPSPAVLPNLRRAGVAAGDIDAVVISHFHADHTFGWPFLLLEFVHSGRDRPLFVIGPPGLEAFLSDMMELGSVGNVLVAARDTLDLQFVEVDQQWQDAGSLRLRAVEVDHVPYLRCFGYVFDRGGPTVGYSGDTSPCAGLDEIAAGVDVLVLECNGPHPAPSHMDTDSVRALCERFPNVQVFLTHVGEDVDVDAIPGVRVPDDFEVVTC